MRKINFLMFFLLLATVMSYGQDTVVQFQKSYGSPDSRDTPYSAFQDSNGNYFVFGTTLGYSEDNTRDLILVKTNENGDEIWTKTYDSDNAIIDYYYPNSVVIPEGSRSNVQYYGYGDQMILTSDGGVAMLATSSGPGGNFPYVVKTDSEGNVLWEKVYSGDAPVQYIESIIEVSDGYLLTGLSTHDGNTAFWLKLDFNGNYVWQKIINDFPGGAGLALGQFSIEMESGNYLGVAHHPYNGSNFYNYFLEIDPNTGATIAERNTSFEGFNFWVIGMEKVSDGIIVVGANWGFYDKLVTAKLDVNGQLVWTKTYDDIGVSTIWGYDVVEGNEGNYYITGYVNNNSLKRLYLVDINSTDGQLNNLQLLNSTMSGYGMSIANTNDGGLLLTLRESGSESTQRNLNIVKTIGVDKPAYVQGKVYINTSDECDFEETDYLFANQLVQVKGEDGGIYQTLTDNDGDYRLIVESGEYELTIENDIIPDDEDECFEEEISLTLRKGQISEGNNFPFNFESLPPPPPGGMCELGLESTGSLQGFGCPTSSGAIIPFRTPCPDTPFIYCISYTNAASQPVIPEVDIEVFLPDFVDGSVQVTSSEDTPMSFVEHQGATPSESDLTITTGRAINPGATFYYCIQLTIAPGNLGPYEISYESTTNNPAEECLVYEAEPIEARCSCDPNDMQVLPEGCGEFGNVDKNQRLVYKVRFENIGPGPAKDVVVTNFIDQNLDVSSLRMGLSSHDITGFQINPNGELIVSFNDIQLNPLQDAPLNQGYFTYSMKPKSGLLDGTTITNQASIVFDENEPVVTNQVLNTLYDDPSVVADFSFGKQCDSYGFDIDFNMLGTSGAGVSYSWDFGANAAPQTSSDINPTGVVFTEGEHEVILTVTKNGCSESITKTVNAVDVGSVGENKVMVCRDGERIITISENALEAQLALGACIGPCAGDTERTMSNEEASGNQLLLYPNPINDVLNVEIRTKGNYSTLVLVDIYGRNVISKNINKQIVSLNTSNLSKGLYFVTVLNDKNEQVLVRKVFKN